MQCFIYSMRSVLCSVLYTVCNAMLYIQYAYVYCVVYFIQYVMQCFIYSMRSVLCSVLYTVCNAVLYIQHA